jgi:hypothetical protein
MGRVVAATLLWMSVHACTDVNGGAIELSWKLRPSNGLPCGSESCCDESRVQQIALHWDVVDGAGATVSGGESWSCSENRAVTRFEVPSGEATLWVVPVCGGGDAPPERFEAPAPLVRTVTDGAVMSLPAFVIEYEADICP